MKKLINIALKITGFLTILSLINSNIKKVADFSVVNNVLETNDLFYKSKHGNMRYRVIGKTEENKPKVLLIHNLMIGGSINEFATISKALSTKYEVYKLDMLGFGHSDKPDINYNSYLYITLINDFINDVIGGKTSILATGLSADFAFIAREANESMIEKLYLINPYGFVQDNYGGLVTKAKKEIVNLPIIGTTIANIVSSRFFIKKYLMKDYYYNPILVDFEKVDNYYYNAHYKCGENKHALAHLFTHFLKVDTKQRLVKSDKKTTIILGENITKFDPYRAKEILEVNENNNIYIVPYSRELVATEKVSEVINIMLNSN